MNKERRDDDGDRSKRISQDMQKDSVHIFIAVVVMMMAVIVALFLTVAMSM